MVVAKNIKETILSELNTQQLVRIPASEEEYFSVVSDLPFKIEYHENEKSYHVGLKHGTVRRKNRHKEAFNRTMWN